jgi:uncharacterized protein YlzI (FlbEa/FlbD family)
MTEFIKLTKESGRSVHVNISKIESLERINDLTQVETTTASYMVKEKPKEIKGLIHHVRELNFEADTFTQFSIIKHLVKRMKIEFEAKTTPENQAASHE